MTAKELQKRRARQVLKDKAFDAYYAAASARQNKKDIAYAKREIVPVELKEIEKEIVRCSDNGWFKATYCVESKSVVHKLAVGLLIDKLRIMGYSAERGLGSEMVIRVSWGEPSNG